MKPSDLLTSRVEGDGIALIGQYEHKIRFIGSSIQINARKGVSTNIIYITVPKDESGIIAIEVLRNYGKRDCVSFEFFLYFENKGEKGSQIKLDDPWIPNADRTGFIFNHYGIDTIIDGVKYTSSEQYRKPQDHFVPDSNLLCQYIFGDVEADAVIEAAEEHEEEEKAQEELPKVKEELERANERIRTLEIAYREERKISNQWERAAQTLKKEVLKTRCFRRKKDVVHALSCFPKGFLTNEKAEDVKIPLP